MLLSCINSLWFAPEEDTTRKILNSPLVASPPFLDYPGVSSKLWHSRNDFMN